jgi:branched-chain amino acid transport system substrate-binding protein
MQIEDMRAKSPFISRRSFVGTGLAATGAIVLSTPFISKAGAADPAILGVILQKQGVMANQGADIALGVQQAVAEHNDVGHGRPVKIVWLDEQTPQDAVQNYRRLVNQENALAVVGGTSSANTLAIGAAAKAERVPFVGLNASAREVTGVDCNRFLFRCPPSVPVYARGMGNYVLERGKKWYFIVASFAFGDDVLTTFGDIVKGAGGEVVGSDSVPVGTTDYSSYLLKVRQARPDVLVSGAANVGPILNQMYQMGLTGAFDVAGPAVSDTDLWSVTPEALTGIYGKPWYFADPTNTADEKAFTEAYIKANNAPPSDRIWMGWYATGMVLEAMNSLPSPTPEGMVTAIEGVRRDEGGIVAHFRDWDHQLVRRLVVAEAQQGATDKAETVKVIATEPKDNSGLDALYGTPEEVGCDIESL